MMPHVVIRPEAEADVAEAFAWYEERRPGLGDRFLLSVEAVLAAIERYPESNGLGTKRRRLRRESRAARILQLGP